MQKSGLPLHLAFLIVAVFSHAGDLATHYDFRFAVSIRNHFSLEVVLYRTVVNIVGKLSARGLDICCPHGGGYRLVILQVPLRAFDPKIDQQRRILLDALSLASQSSTAGEVIDLFYD